MLNAVGSRAMKAVTIDGGKEDIPPKNQFRTTRFEIVFIIGPRTWDDGSRETIDPGSMILFA